MEHVLLGDAEEGPTLTLDHREFAYAGKFVMSTTGKAVARSGEEVLAAVAFNQDRTNPNVAWLRYVSVREDRRGEGIGPRLCRFLSTHLLESGYETVRIAVNNPIAYEALYRAGFAYTGEETGIAELVLEHPGDRSPKRYRSGYEVFLDRDLDAANRAVLDRHREGEPPSIVEPPD